VFSLKRKEHELTDLENAITLLVAQIADGQGETDEYTAMAGNLKTLMEARQIESDVDSKHDISVETIATVTANLVGIIMILNYERVNIVTSKALSFVIKPKSLR
jgi:hypothetical protein